MKRLATLVSSLVWLAACGGPAPERLVIYTPHGKELLTSFERAFEAANPAVDVQWLDMGAQQIYDRVLTERRRPQASLWWGGPNLIFNLAADEGLLEPYEPSWSEAVTEEAHHPENLWYATFVTPEVIMYNTAAVTQEAAPKDWDDLLDPEWKDRIIIRYPLASGTMRTIFGALILRQPTVEDGFAWLARLDRNTKTYAADPTQLYLKIARGEGDVTLWNMPDTEIQAREVGYPFAYLFPASGTPVITEGIALVKGGPNPAAARAFYEFVTSRDALLRQAQDNHRIPARSDIDPTLLPDWIRSANAPSMPLDWKLLAEEGAAWLQFWDEHIKGRGEAYLAEVGR